MIRRTLLALALGCIVLVTGCGQKIDYRQLEQRNGLSYKMGDNDPFAGTVKNAPISQFAMVGENGTCTVQMKGGLVDGAVSCESEKGTRLYESRWLEGKRDGTEKVWYATNGNLVGSVEWKAGRRSGREQRYNPLADKVISEINWVDDHKVGRERYWDTKGETVLVDLDWKNGSKTGFSNAGQWQEHFVDGQVDGVRQHFTTEDSAMASAFADDDQLARELGGGATSMVAKPGAYVNQEENWKAGVQVGASKTWRGQGQLSEESTYLNGKRVTWRQWNKNGTLSRETYFEPDNPENRFGSDEMARRSYDEQGKILEVFCRNDDCSGINRAIPNPNAPQMPGRPGDAAVAATSETVGQCVYPTTRVGKDNRLELPEPVSIFASSSAADGHPFTTFDAFWVIAEQGELLQIGDKESKRPVGWVRRAQFDVVPFRNCNL